MNRFAPSTKFKASLTKQLGFPRLLGFPHDWAPIQPQTLFTKIRPIELIRILDFIK